MARLCMNDKQWQRIQPLIPKGKPGGRPTLDRRNILDGILWILRTGAPWRDLPEAFGTWQTAWRVNGVHSMLLEKQLNSRAIE